MVTEVERLIVRLEATQRQFEKQMQFASRVAAKNATGIERRFDKMNKSVSRSSRFAAQQIAQTGATLAAGLSVRAVTQYADAWTVAGNKIAAASQISGIQARSLEELNDIADDTRSGITETVDLYAKLLRATKGVAKSEEEVARATTIVNKAFKAGGAAASEQAAGILQLAQGLSSGVLQGDELRSIRENAPLVAQAIADEFKTTIGGLKDLGAEGELTSARVFRAILASQSSIGAAFATTNATISESFLRLSNAVTEYIGGSDVAGVASEKIAKALGLLADNLDAVAIALSLVAARGVAPLAAGLIARLIPSLGAASTAVRLLTVRGGAAIVTMSALRGVLALLGGPIGVLLTAATGAAFAFSRMKDSAEIFSEASAALHGTLSGLETINDSLLKDYEQLKVALEAVATAQTAGGQAAIDAANRDVAAAQARINANAALRRELAVQAAINLSNLEAALADEEAAFIESGRKRLVADKRYARELAISKQEQGTASEGITEADVLRFIDGERQKIAALALTGQAVSDVDTEFNNASISVLKNAEAVDVARGNVEALVGEAEQLHGPLDNAATSSGDIVSALGRIDFSNPIAGAVRLAQLLRQAALNAASIGNPEAPTGEVGRGGAVDPRKFDGRAEFRRQLAKAPAIKSPKATGGGGSGSTRIDEALQFVTALETETVALEAQITSIGKNGAALVEFTTKQKLLADAKRQGIDLDKVTAGSNQTVRQQIDAHAAAMGRLSEQYEQGRAAEEDFLQGVDAISNSFADAITSGENLRESFGNILKGIANDIIKSGISSLLVEQFSPKAGSSGGGIFGRILGGLFGGFEDGGFTGRGGKSEPAGVVHKGEYVFTKAATERLGVGNLEALQNGGLPGFMSGGLVGSVPAVSRSVSTSGASSQANELAVTVYMQNDGNLATFVQQTAGPMALEISTEVVKQTAPNVVAEHQGRNG